jgi:hypothetical protein
MFFQTVEKLDESELVYSFLISVGQYYRSVDFRSRRFAFRGRIMKKPKCRLFHKQILLGAGAELLVALLLRGLICPAAPAGVCAPSTPINRVSITYL